MRTLNDACEAIVDCEHKTAPIDPEGRHFAVGTPAMRGNRIDFDKARRVSHDTFLKWTRRLAPRAGDLLLAREAPVGPVVRIPEAPLVAPGQRTVLLRPDEDKLNSGYAFYLLSSPSMQAALWEKAEGSTVPHLNVADIRNLELPRLPAIHEQRAIAATLGALDDKIESNTRLSGTLRSLILVEFRRFLGASLPKIALSELVSITSGRSYRSSELQDSTTALVTLKSIDRAGGYKPDGLKAYVGPYKPAQEIRPGELVVAQTDLTQQAEVVGRGVRVPASQAFETLVASLDLAIVRPLEGMPVEYLHGLLTTESFRQHCRNHVTGTTVLHLAKDAIPSWEAPVAPKGQQVEYAAFARSVFARLDALSEESIKLARLRDALLPELLSGRIRVHEALS